MIYFTERDKTLLNKLADYELLSTKQLRELVFPKVTKTTVLRRLRKLESEKLIRRVHVLRGGELIWTLTAPGAIPIHREHFLENINRNTLEHDVTLNDVRLMFEKLGLVVGWHTEQALRRASGTKQKTLEPQINPDAIISVKTVEGIKAVALELELSGPTRE